MAYSGGFGEQPQAGRRDVAAEKADNTGEGAWYQLVKSMAADFKGPGVLEGSKRIELINKGWSLEQLKYLCKLHRDAKEVLRDNLQSAKSLGYFDKQGNLTPVAIRELRSIGFTQEHMDELVDAYRAERTPVSSVAMNAKVPWRTGNGLGPDTATKARDEIRLKEQAQARGEQVRAFQKALAEGRSPEEAAQIAERALQDASYRAQQRRQGG